MHLARYGGEVRGALRKGNPYRLEPLLNHWLSSWAPEAKSPLPPNLWEERGFTSGRCRAKSILIEIARHKALTHALVLRSSKNSDAGSVPVTSRWSRARVQATYRSWRSVLYTSSRSLSSVTVSIRSWSGMTSSSQAITPTARNSSPFARCMVPTETLSGAMSMCSSRILCFIPAFSTAAAARSIWAAERTNKAISCARKPSAPSFVSHFRPLQSPRSLMRKP